ncbi:MAG: J domain-containing protein [Proteobacteria bacterium]|nr:J domain-containing protein [Pseudomonadota bacterium]
MTTSELTVSFLCTVAGYVAVSWLLDRGGKRDAERRPDDGMPPRSAPPPGAREAPWHRVLGVSAQATRAEIASAYRALISQYHPDKVTRLGPEIRAVAERKSAEINRAYEQALRARPEFP